MFPSENLSLTQPQKGSGSRLKRKLEDGTHFWGAGGTIKCKNSTKR